MKIVLGVDSQRFFQSAVSLIGRMRFENCEVDAHHVFESVQTLGLVVPPDFGVSLSLDISRITDAIEKHGKEVLNESVESLHKLGVDAKASQSRGHAAAELLTRGESADLIAVGSAKKGSLESTFLGSVTHTLAAHSKKSLLIGKGHDDSTATINAVFATDHSEYANRCVGELLRLKPQGISALTVVTAFQLEVSVGMMPVPVPNLQSSVMDKIQEELAKLNGDVCTRLGDLGAKCESIVRRGDPNEVIESAMRETGADILIIGAKGHSAIERMAYGSVAFHQVCRPDYSVMVLRLPE